MIKRVIHRLMIELNIKYYIVILNTKSLKPIIIKLYLTKYVIIFLPNSM